MGVGQRAGYRQAARALGFRHARVQQVVVLLGLPVTVQAEVLLGRGEFGERQRRWAAAARD